MGCQDKTEAPGLGGGRDHRWEAGGGWRVGGRRQMRPEQGGSGEQDER